MYTVVAQRDPTTHQQASGNLLISTGGPGVQPPPRVDGMGVLFGKGGSLAVQLGVWLMFGLGNARSRNNAVVVIVDILFRCSLFVFCCIVCCRCCCYCCCRGCLFSHNVFIATGIQAGGKTTKNETRPGSCIYMYLENSHFHTIYCNNNETFRHRSIHTHRFEGAPRAHTLDYYGYHHTFI